MSRVGWAVAAAEYVLPAVKVTWGAGNSIDGEMALEKAQWLYRDLLYYVGTVPVSRLDEVYDATVFQGATVTAALDAIGA